MQIKDICSFFHVLDINWNILHKIIPVVFLCWAVKVIFVFAQWNVESLSNNYLRLRLCCYTFNPDAAVWSRAAALICKPVTARLDTMPPWRPDDSRQRHTAEKPRQKTATHQDRLQSRRSLWLTADAAGFFPMQGHCTHWNHIPCVERPWRNYVNPFHFDFESIS